jgi:hypothetical protein
MADWLREAGFEGVETKKLIPVDPWPKDKKLKEIGKYYRVHMLDGAEYL